jgi:hypothetical protein
MIICRKDAKAQRKAQENGAKKSLRLCAFASNNIIQIF